MIPAPAFSGSAFAFSRPLFWRSAFSRSAVYGLRFRGLCFRDAQQKPATFVYRAGTKSEDGPSFDLKDKSIDEVWLVTSPKLFFPLGQDLPVSSKKRLEEVCLWTLDISNLNRDVRVICYPKYDGVIQVELNDSGTSKNPVEEIQTCLKSLEWQKTTVAQCKGGFSLMNLSPLVQAVIVYMRDHYPTTPEELNFHAELKAASQWCWSDDYKQLVMKKAPVGDCRLKIAATETLKTWKKKERNLQTIKGYERGNDSDSSDESVDEKLSDVREAIAVLKKYLGRGASAMSDMKESVQKRQMESLGKQRF